jgi:hypothetical protein
MKTKTKTWSPSTQNKAAELCSEILLSPPSSTSTPVLHHPQIKISANKFYHKETLAIMPHMEIT